jgi:Curli production assembly/transport component CsgG
MMRLLLPLLLFVSPVFAQTDAGAAPAARAPAHPVLGVESTSQGGYLAVDLRVIDTTTGEIRSRATGAGSPADARVGGFGHGRRRES